MAPRDHWFDPCDKDDHLLNRYYFMTPLALIEANALTRIISAFWAKATRPILLSPGCDPQFPYFGMYINGIPFSLSSSATSSLALRTKSQTGLPATFSPVGARKDHRLATQTAATRLLAPVLRGRTRYQQRTESAVHREIELAERFGKHGCEALREVAVNAANSRRMARRTRRCSPGQLPHEGAKECWLGPA